MTFFTSVFTFIMPQSVANVVQYIWFSVEHELVLEVMHFILVLEKISCKREGAKIMIPEHSNCWVCSIPWPCIAYFLFLYLLPSMWSAYAVVWEISQNYFCYSTLFHYCLQLLLGSFVCFNVYPAFIVSLANLSNFLRQDVLMQRLLHFILFFSLAIKLKRALRDVQLVK